MIQCRFDLNRKGLWQCQNEGCGFTVPIHMHKPPGHNCDGVETGSDLLPSKKRKGKKRNRKRLLGDRIESALKTVGITPKRVTGWIGRPCGCAERKERLNQVDLWARRIVSGKLDNAKEYLERILSA